MKSDCNLKFPILVDMMDNSVSLKYAAFPERLYVVLDGTVVYAGGAGPFFYSIKELEGFIQNYTSNI